MRDSHNNTGFSTRAIHHGYDPLSHSGALVHRFTRPPPMPFPLLNTAQRALPGM